jgi:hypothetical protein
MPQEHIVLGMLVAFYGVTPNLEIDLRGELEPVFARTSRRGYVALITILVWLGMAHLACMLTEVLLVEWVGFLDSFHTVAVETFREHANLVAGLRAAFWAVYLITRMATETVQTL